MKLLFLGLFAICTTQVAFAVTAGDENQKTQVDAEARKARFISLGYAHQNRHPAVPSAHQNAYPFFLNKVPPFMGGATLEGRSGYDDDSAPFPFEPHKDRDKHLYEECKFPFVITNNECIYGPVCVDAATSQTYTWSQARNFCRQFGHGYDLATFDNANQHNAAIEYIHEQDKNGVCSYFIGGENTNAEWIWINGKLMPLETPFWIQNEPTGTAGMDFAYLESSSFYLIGETDSTTLGVPLCRFIPEEDESCPHDDHHSEYKSFSKPSYDPYSLHRKDDATAYKTSDQGEQTTGFDLFRKNAHLLRPPQHIPQVGSGPQFSSNPIQNMGQHQHTPGLGQHYAPTRFQNHVPQRPTPG